MVKIEFTNAKVEDSGFGLIVNGDTLEEIISMALGTKVKGVSYTDPRFQKLKKFKANSCDITVIIKPHPQTVLVENDDYVYESLKELEDSINEQIKQETTEAES